MVLRFLKKDAKSDGHARRRFRRDAATMLNRAIAVSSVLPLYLFGFNYF
jgi:hypothetical protein